MEAAVNTQHLAGALHFGSQHGIHAVQLFKAEHGHLYGHIIGIGEQARAVAHIGQLFAQRAAHSQIHHGHAGHLADIGHRAAGTGVHLDHIHLFVLHGILHIHQAHHMQLAGKSAGVVHQRVDHLFAQVLGRIAADGVARVNAGALYLLHDAGDQEIGAVADGIHFALGAVDVFIHQHRVAHIHMGGDNAHVFGHIGAAVGHDHILAAQHIAGAHQHGIAHFLGSLECLGEGVYGAALGTGNAAALQQFVKALTVLGFVNGIGGGAQNGQADLLHVLGQLDGGLAAKLHHTAVRLFGGDDIVHAFGGEGVKIQAVAGVKVGGNGFGVVVYQHCLAAVFLQGPHSVYRAVVKLDALADADGA